MKFSFALTLACLSFTKFVLKSGSLFSLMADLAALPGDTE